MRNDGRPTTHALACSVMHALGPECAALSTKIRSGKKGAEKQGRGPVLAGNEEDSNVRQRTGNLEVQTRWCLSLAREVIAPLCEEAVVGKLEIRLRCVYCDPICM